VSRPVSWLVIERGWSVVDPEGRQIGHVEEVVGESGKDIFNGLRVTTGFFATHYVPAERVAGIEEGRVELQLGEEELKALGDEPPSGG
jgi:hypothetical protein